MRASSSPFIRGSTGTARPETLRSIKQVGELYRDLLAELGLQDVVVVGNSIGGWIAAEIAASTTARLASAIVIDAVGLEVPGRPVVDFFSLSFEEIARHSYFEPKKFVIDQASLSEEQQQAMATNRQTLAIYGGKAMTDPTLRDRLAKITVPTLVLWGEADRIADPDYGRAYSEAIPGSRFEILPRTGHLPQVETPENLLPTLWRFASIHFNAT
jgi:pimeloyl-ACP methyl ester carboxylesterase